MLIKDYVKIGLVVALLVVLVAIGITSKGLGEKALSGVQNVSRSVDGSSYTGTVVIEDINIYGEDKVDVYPHTGGTAKIALANIDENGLFTKTESYDSNGNLEKITYTQIDQSRDKD